MSSKSEKALMYLEKKYGIHSIEQLSEEMSKTELDIGAFTMPFKPMEMEGGIK